MELSYTSRSRSFLYFGKQNFLIFQNISYIQNPSIFRTMTYLEPKEYSEQCQKMATKRIFLYFEKRNFLVFPSSNSKQNALLKNFFYFRKWNFLTPGLKNFSYFRREFAMPENQNILTVLFKHKRKRKKFLILLLIKKQNFLN